MVKMEYLLPRCFSDHGIHDIDIEPDSAKTTENMPLTIDQMREKVKNKRAETGGASQRAFLRKQSMKPAPEISKNLDVDS